MDKGLGLNIMKRLILIILLGHHHLYKKHSPIDLHRRFHFVFYLCCARLG